MTYDFTFKINGEYETSGRTVEEAHNNIMEEDFGDLHDISWEVAYQEDTCDGRRNDRVNVYFDVTGYFDAEVEADDLKEAKSKAMDMIYEADFGNLTNIESKLIEHDHETVKKNDLLICAPERDNPVNKVFDIYARVTEVNNRTATLDRYQKFGALRYSKARYNQQTLDEYYRPMTEEEKKTFADTMFGRRIDKNSGMIHFGGDDRYKGWEHITGDVLETLLVLNEYRTKDKNEPVLLSPDKWEYDAHIYPSFNKDGDMITDGWMWIRVGEYQEHSLYVTPEVFVYEDDLRIIPYPDGEYCFDFEKMEIGEFKDRMKEMWDTYRLPCEMIYKNLEDYFKENDRQIKDTLLSIISEKQPEVYKKLTDVSKEFAGEKESADEIEMEER